MAKKILRQPTAEEQRMLKDVTTAEVSFVTVRGKQWKVEWMRNITLDYVSRVMLRRSRKVEAAARAAVEPAANAVGTGADDVEMKAAVREATDFERAYADDPVRVGAEENKVVCKCAALMKLNGYWSIRLLYWLVWRWFYYVKQYNESDLGEFIAECKKKVPVMDYLMCTTLLTAMMDTKKQMNRAEVNRIQVEQLSAQRAALAKNTPS